MTLLRLGFLFGPAMPGAYWLMTVLVSRELSTDISGLLLGPPAGPSVPTMDTLVKLANPDCPHCLTRRKFTSHGYRCDDCGLVVGDVIANT